MYKKIKIALFISITMPHAEFKFSELLYGNPGIGGAQYEMLLLATILAEIYDITIYSNKAFIFDSIPVFVEINDDAALSRAIHDSIDIYISNIKKATNSFFNIASSSNIKIIAWAHNFLSYEQLRYFATSKNIKRVIFVGQQQYDKYIDDIIIKKADFIFNMISVDKKRLNYLDKDHNNMNVIYLGAIIPEKGFHILASVWKDITKKVNNATLYIIGSGKLYNHNCILGEYGIAEAKYEHTFIKYLTNKEGELLPSVRPLGVLGVDKDIYMYSNSIGITNPSGRTETFCISAVEFESHGIPVITFKGFGLLDTVIHKKTGFLCKRRSQFKKHIICLLNNKNIYAEMSRNATEFSKHFDIQKISNQWYSVIQEVIDDISPVNHFSYNNWLNDCKWLRYLNSRAKTVLSFIPSIALIETSLKEYLLRH